MKRKGLVTGIMAKAATLFDEVAEGFWIVQYEAERRARGMGPEFDLTPRGRLAELARRAAAATLLADRTWYLDPMEGFPLAVEALQGLEGMRRGGAMTMYIKAETLWRKTWGGALDDESIRRAAACRLACNCAAYRAVAEMRAIEAGAVATGDAGGELQKAAEARRTRGKAIPSKVRDTVGQWYEENHDDGETIAEAYDRFIECLESKSKGVAGYVTGLTVFKRVVLAYQRKKRREEEAARQKGRRGGKKMGNP